jgi:hypothetical protein
MALQRALPASPTVDQVQQIAPLWLGRALADRTEGVTSLVEREILLYAVGGRH